MHVSALIVREFAMGGRDGRGLDCSRSGAEGRGGSEIRAVFGHTKEDGEWWGSWV